MLPPGLNSPREVVLYYDSVYYSLIESGQAHPFLYPWGGIGVYAVLLYLLIDHRNSPLLSRLRYVVFAFLCAFSGWSIAMNKARMPSSSFGVGLVSALAILISFAILVARDGQSEFTRVERRREESKANGSLSNGHPKGDLANAWHGRCGRLYWQAYPSAFIDRVDWVSDLFTNFRGTGWSFQIAQLPPLPKWAEAQLSNKAQDDETSMNNDEKQIIVGKPGIRRFTSRKALITDTIKHLTIDYLALDLIKTLMHHDPYFWGYTSTSQSPTYFPTALRTSPTFLKSYRLGVSLAAIYTALHLIFKLGPLIFAGVLGPRWLGVRGEAWMNPADMFGNPAAIWEKGLAGWWGGWWHQTFRLGFEAPTRYLLARLGVPKKSYAERVIALFMAFFLSGFLHASGSYTQLGETRPLQGPMLFFMLQPFGILAQMGGTAVLQRAGVLRYVPGIVKQVANVVLVHVWLYYTAPLLINDFAEGGIWLYEPVAISPLRGLGFGKPDDSWWCWWGPPWWRTGAHWFDTGIAF